MKKTIWNVLKFIIVTLFYGPLLCGIILGVGDLIFGETELNEVEIKSTTNVETLASITDVESEPVSEPEPVTESSYTRKTSYVSYGTCAATTKKGTRCRRKASKGSIYCWQHK